VSAPIAVFDEPPRVSIRATWCASRNGLLLGFENTNDSELYGIIVLEDGEIAEMKVTEFTVDYRYRVETDRWYDLDAPEAAQGG
jgi:hypothetical protein